MKKGYRVLLALLLVFSVMLAACSKTGEETQPQPTDKGREQNDSTKAESAKVSAKGEFPIVPQKATLNVMIQQDSAVLDYINNEFTKFLEEKTNVQINWTLVPHTDWNTRLNLLFASGSDLPDIIMGGVNNDLVSKYGPQGVFQPLNELINKHSVEFVQVIDKVEGAKKMITAPDGNIYGLPKIVECYNCTMARKMWVNQVFLDNLGLAVPTTTDEFYNMLKMFKEQDPNKNGKADEIPLIGSVTGWNQNVDMFIMSAFVLNPGGNRFILKEDTITSAYTTSEWREGLSYMKNLADEKLLDPVSFTQKQEQVKQLVEGGEVPIVGAIPSGGPHVFANVNGERFKDFVAIPPLKGPSGVQQSIWDPYGYVQASHMMILTNACQDECADIAVKWADQFYNEEVTARSRLGVPEVDWEKAPDGSIGVNGKPAAYKAILQWGSDQKSHWNFTNPGYWPREWTEGTVYDPSNPWELQYLLTKATIDHYEPFKQRVVPPLSLETSEAEEFAQLGSIINPYVEESIARFILGGLDLEKDWDGYLKELDKMGITRYLEIAQSAYDRQWK
ncbi:extracellular solute-binding protein [Paenibacillus sp. F411]|uniref:extracellular solute-binding protein n=1 Tax=Paenibacillus sp. F411 TaxID=2820239 RepID=UPI001AAFA857|nr:extracellular solute-binding protein [Paenibacillus sp. F411]MBO2944884.1 extracellular solute-binding protein [Paenibacillus sp. F411]